MPHPQYRAAAPLALLLLACAACASCAATPPPLPSASPPPVPATSVLAPPASATTAPAAQPAPPITAPSISADALEQRLAAAGQPPTLLDVRTPEEFAAGHVPGARNIPVQELDARLGELAAARGGDIVVYCRSGRRAASALQTLQAQGFERLLHLEGDMQGWSAGGHRVEMASGTPPAASGAPH